MSISLEDQLNELLIAEVNENKKNLINTQFRNDKYYYYFYDYEVNENAKKWYAAAEGGELKLGKNGTPPKLYSVASSSRFCYESLIKIPNAVTLFAEPNDEIDISTVRAELELPIKGIRGRKPNMDAFAKGKIFDYFFETKCQEILEDHDILLSKQYFMKNKLPNSIFPIDNRKEVIDDKSAKYVIDPTEVGLAQKYESGIEVKQLLTHIMGIASYEKKYNRPSYLIYYFRFPDKYYILSEDNPIREKLDRAIEDAKIIFNSYAIKTLCEWYNIKLKLFIKIGAEQKPASKDNTFEIEI